VARTSRTAVRITGIAALVLAAGAVGYTYGPSVEVPRGGNATFLPSHWNCRNLAIRVECRLGDSHPYVELTRTRRGGVTVRVRTLRDPLGGRMTRTYVKGRPVYTFTAF
jgi:hypothetical protein